MCAPAGNDEVFYASTREDEIPEGARDGDGGEGSDGVNQIGGAHAAALGCDESRDIGRAEFFAAGGFGRRHAEERMREQLV